MKNLQTLKKTGGKKPKKLKLLVKQTSWPMPKRKNQKMGKIKKWK